MMQEELIKFVLKQENVWLKNNDYIIYPGLKYIEANYNIII